MDYVTNSLTGVGKWCEDVGATTGVLAVTAAIFVVLYNWDIWDRHLWPPGPMPLPFIGNLLFMARANPLFKKIYELREVYGDVVTLHLPLGGKWVILNSPEAMHEGFIKNADLLNERTTKKGLIIDYESPHGWWKVRRKFIMSVLKEHGVGGKGIEGTIHEEISHFFNLVNSKEGEPMDLEDILPKVSSNVITEILFGRRFEYDDKHVLAFDFATFVGMKMKAKMLPFIPFTSAYRKEKSKVDNSVEVMEEHIQEHRENLDDEAVKQDMIHSFLKEQRKQKENPESLFTDKALLSNLSGLYLAGTDTTAYSLYWAFLYLVLYPDAQEKMSTEIREVLGARPVSYSDREILPFTASAITELIRVPLIGASGLPKLALEDVTVCGVRIPKGATVVANNFSTCHNEEIYPDCGTFKPDRFLDSDGKFQKPDKFYWTPFGIGRRICLGQHLAQTEMFLLVVTVLQNYRVVLGQEERPSLKGAIKKLMSAPVKNYLVKLIPHS